jgi:DNA adenine methylase
MLSNSDNEFVRDLYADFPIHTLHAANRAINCRAEHRGKISQTFEDL